MSSYGVYKISIVFFNTTCEYRYLSKEVNLGEGKSRQYFIVMITFVGLIILGILIWICIVLIKRNKMMKKQKMIVCEVDVNDNHQMES